MVEGYWRAVLTAGLRVPPDRPLDDLTADLVDMLGDPDPTRRDELAHCILSTWLRGGVYDDLLAGFGDGVAVGLGTGLGAVADDTVFRRSGSARMLSEVVARDNEARLVGHETVLRWGDNAAVWLLRERDLRGWVPQRGWAHALRYGADLLGRLARSPHLRGLELTVLLDVVADRLTLPTRHVLHHREDDRLAHAVMVILHRDLVPFEVLEPWIVRLGSAIRPSSEERANTEWPTPAAANTASFLRALHLQLALGVRGSSAVSADSELFADPPARRADLLLLVLDQLRAASPQLFALPAARAGAESPL